MTMPLKASRIDTDMKSMPKAKAGFIEPMVLLRTEALPEGTEWIYELKLDGYRALGVKASGQVQLRSRNDNDFCAVKPAARSRQASGMSPKPPNQIRGLSSRPSGCPLG